MPGDVSEDDLVELETLYTDVSIEEVIDDTFEIKIGDDLIYTVERDDNTTTDQNGFFR